MKGRYYSITWEGEKVCEVYATNRRAALMKARDYLNATGRLFDIRKLEAS